MYLFLWLSRVPQNPRTLLKHVRNGRMVSGMGWVLASLQWRETIHPAHKKCKTWCNSTRLWHDNGKAKSTVLDKYKLKYKHIKKIHKKFQLHVKCNNCYYIPMYFTEYIYIVSIYMKIFEQELKCQLSEQTVQLLQVTKIALGGICSHWVLHTLSC